MKMKATKGMGTMPMDPKPMMPEERDHEAEGHYDTLMRAHEVQNNPEMMARVKKVAGRRLKAAVHINTVADLKAIRKSMRMKKMNGDM